MIRANTNDEGMVYTKSEGEPEQLIEEMESLIETIRIHIRGASMEPIEYADNLNEMGAALGRQWMKTKEEWKEAGTEKTL